MAHHMEMQIHADLQDQGQNGHSKDVMCYNN